MLLADCDNNVFENSKNALKLNRITKQDKIMMVYEQNNTKRRNII